MNYKNYEDVRKGPGVRWKIEGHNGEVTGFQIDNLDTKPVEEATSKYEKTFILVRDILHQNESRCMDSEEDRLHCTQVITDALRGAGLFRAYDDV